nr:MAG TPA: hypothetical protein [Caudoviricetes sp.]
MIKVIVCIIRKSLKVNRLFLFHKKTLLFI